jgi:CheY-like chemotaxis protein
VTDGGGAILDAQKHVVVVERDAAVRQIISDLLVDLGCRVDIAENAAGMPGSLAGSDPVNLIVLDATVSCRGVCRRAWGLLALGGCSRSRDPAQKAKRPDGARSRQRRRSFSSAMTAR